jgi:hypothetical protein
MILGVALGIVLGLVLLVMGFYALDWIAAWWSKHWLHFGIPLGLLLYAVFTDSPSGIGWSGLLLIGGILLDLRRQHKEEEARARDRIEADMVREALKWHNGRDPGAWETHKDKG